MPPGTGCYGAIITEHAPIPGAPFEGGQPREPGQLIDSQEGTACMFAAFVHAKAFLSPRSVGAKSRLAGYWVGLKMTAQLYVLVIAVLLIAAIYEVLEAALLLNVLRG